MMNVKKLVVLGGMLSATLVVHAYAIGPNTLALSSSKTSVPVGESITVTVSVASPTQAMNAVSGSLTIPGTLSVGSISTSGSVVNFWTQEPSVIGNRIQFEGIVLNPGYIGTKAKVFTFTLTAKRAGTASIMLTDGAILANDGLGTNIIDTLGSTSIAVTQWVSAPIAVEPGETPTVAVVSGKPIILPIITDYSPAIDNKSPAFFKGKGQPNSITKIVFENTMFKSVGERFLDIVRSQKQTLTDVFVKNDATGAFEYTSNNNLIAGVYKATPFLVDDSTSTERPGLGVQLLVNDSKIVHYLVILINVLGLLVPIVGLIVLIYFIPWYSLRRMHLLRRRLGLEEEKIELSQHKLKHQENTLK